MDEADSKNQEDEPIINNPEFRPPPPKRSKKPLLIILVVLVAAALGGGLAWMLMRKPAHIPVSSSNQVTDTQAATPEQIAQMEELRLDMAKNYGDKYQNGLLPVGDKKYVIDTAKKGYIYLCSANFVAEGQAGAQARGPWFVNGNT